MYRLYLFITRKVGFLVWKHNFIVFNIKFILETCMNSLVKVLPYSKLNFQGKITFTQNWCNITLTNDCMKMNERILLRDEKINIHGCWGKHAHIPNNDYWGICLFHVVWTIFFGAIILMWYTRNIFLLASDIFFNWTVRMSDNLPIKSSNLGSRAYHLHYCMGKQNYLLSNILWFALKICFWADF
jgi:hypothetical protein